MSSSHLPPPSAADAAVEAGWQALFSLAKKEAEDRRVLTRQLASWAQQCGLSAAALYGRMRDDLEGGPYTLQASFGEKFQACRELDELTGDQVQCRDGDGEAPSDVDADYGVVPLPDAVLLFRGENAPPSTDPELLLLAAGARISHLKRQVQEQRFQAKFRGVELEALYDVGLAIASTLDLEELCDEALLRAVSLLDARRGALYLIDSDGAYRLTSRFGGQALPDFTAESVDVNGLTSGEKDCPSELLPGGSHLLAVPVEIEGSPRGLLAVADKESRRGVGPFPTTDRRTLALFANQAAIAIENAKLHKLALEKERLEREMELAAEIQNQLLPKAMPSIPGFEVIGWNRPAQQVGGDYFDLQGLGDDRWGMVVGDVTGKGLPAALLVSTLHSALRLLLDRMEVGPALVERLNRHIYESSSANKFITMLMAAIDVRSGQLAYLNAGHNPGLVIRHDGSVEQLSSGGLPLGLMPNVPYTKACLDLHHEDVVCLYSDGITECEAPDEEEFGQERLTQLLIEKRERPLTEIIAAIDRAVVDFACGQAQGDDQTVVLLRRSPAAG